MIITTNLSFGEWALAIGLEPSPIGLEPMAPRWLALQTGNDSFRFKASTAAARKAKEGATTLTPA